MQYVCVYMDGLNLADAMCTSSDNGLTITDINNPTLPLLPAKIEKRTTQHFLPCVKQPFTHLRYYGSHFVPVHAAHGFQICPCNSMWSSECCVREYVCSHSLQESGSIVNSYSRESLQTKLSDP